tara:strand:+ start:1416 stop:1811 length:396 start_codon:yes stop_codon:yes gene_type:complete
MKQMLAILTTFCLMQGTAQAQDAATGKGLYDNHCAVCHGAEARGNGPMAPALLLQPPSLREMSARHGGFPITRIVTRIDGRDPLISHGSPMPIYGPFFEGDDTALKSETGQPIMTSRAIVDLVAFLQGIQD